MTALLNPEGLRYPDEFVRHKALDAIGDLALAGAPLLGAYKSVRGGHKLNHAMLCALIADPTAWTVVEAKEPVRRAAAMLTSTSVAPAYRRRPVLVRVNRNRVQEDAGRLPPAIIAWRIWPSFTVHVRGARGRWLSWGYRRS